MCLVPSPVLLCLEIKPKVMAYSPKDSLSERGGRILQGSVIFLLFILFHIEKGAVLQAGLEVVHHSPLEVLHAAGLS